MRKKTTDGLSDCGDNPPTVVSLARKLNGWQRLWVLVGALWLAPLIWITHMVWPSGPLEEFWDRKDVRALIQYDEDPGRFDYIITGKDGRVLKYIGDRPTVNDLDRIEGIDSDPASQELRKRNRQFTIIDKVTGKTYKFEGPDAPPPAAELEFFETHDRAPDRIGDTWLVGHHRLRGTAWHGSRFRPIRRPLPQRSWPTSTDRKGMLLALRFFFGSSR